VVSAPSINATRFDGQAQISGSYTLQEAEDLAIALGSGRLPAPVAEMGGADPIDGACPTIRAEG
jgi:preprotein translocase subunit SecD